MTKAKDGKKEPITQEEADKQLAAAKARDMVQKK